MRGLRNFIVGILSAVIIAVLAIFAVENLQGITAHFIGATFTPSVWWVSIGSAVLGFILAFLLLAPGRVASGWRARSLARERLRREQEMSVLRQEHDSLRAQHAHLQAEREGLQTERDQLRTRIAAANEVPTAPATTEQTAASDASANYRTDQAYRSDQPYQGDQEAYAATARPDGNESVTDAEARTDTAAPVNGERHQQLGVGGRLRSMLGRQRDEMAPDGEGWNPDQPPAPTA